MPGYAVCKFGCAVEANGMWTVLWSVYYVLRDFDPGGLLPKIEKFSVIFKFSAVWKFKFLSAVIFFSPWNFYFLAVNEFWF